MLAKDTVVALGGYLGGSLAVRAGGNGDVTESQRVWHKNRDGSYLGTGVARNGHVFVCDMNGILYCFGVATGEEVWQERLTASTGRASTWSSMSMTADGTMYVLMQNGDTFVGRVSPSGYEQVARNSLGESTNSSVVISDGQLFLRTFDALWCIGSD